MTTQGNNSTGISWRRVSSAALLLVLLRTMQGTCASVTAAWIVPVALSFQFSVLNQNVTVCAAPSDCEHPGQGEKYQGFTLKQWVLAVCASIWQCQARCLSMLGPPTMWWHRFRRFPMGILPRDRIVYRNLSQRSCREVLHVNLSCTLGIEMSYGDLAIEIFHRDLASILPKDAKSGFRHFPRY